MLHVIPDTVKGLIAYLKDKDKPKDGMILCLIVAIPCLIWGSVWIGAGFLIFAFIDAVSKKHREAATGIGCISCFIAFFIAFCTLLDAVDDSAQKKLNEAAERYKATKTKPIIPDNSIVCHRCDGFGELPNGKGTKLIACAVCGGSGRTPRENAKMIDCPGCYGLGHLSDGIKCGACKGMGVIPQRKGGW